MGNICCGYDEEDYKHGVWYNPDDDDTQAEVGTEHPGRLFDNDDDQYNPKAIDLEQKILLHERSAEEEKRASVLTQMTRPKRPSITATPIEFSSSSFSYTPPTFPKSSETTEFLLNIIAHHFVFASIDENTKLQFVSAMQCQEFKEGEWVIHQGEEGDFFYIVEEGQVAFHRTGEELPDVIGSFCTLTSSKDFPLVGTGSKGSSFGELALLYKTPRAASVKALTPLKLYKIDRLTFRSLLMSQRVHDRSNIISLVKKVSSFQDLDEARLHKLADAFTILEFDEGERIVNKGDHGDVIYLIKSGGVKIEDIGHGSSRFKDHMMGEGECFGERALITGETRAANVTAIMKTSLLAMSKRVLEDIIGPLEQAIMNSSHSKYLSSIPFFECLERDEVDRCAMQLKEERFEKGDKILATGKLYLIQEGHALMMLHEENKSDGNPKEKGTSAEPKLVKLEKGDYFGDPWGGFVPDNSITKKSDKMNENLVINVESNMKVLVLLGSDVQRVIGDLRRVANRLDLESNSGEEKGRDGREKSRWSYMQSKSSFDYIKSKRSLANRDLSCLNKLKKHRILGIGTFGKVWLVTPKSDTKEKPTPYALKMVSKRQTLQQNLAKAVLREKNVMESIEHPLLMHMTSSFQDEDYLYFVMDLILGGELFELLYVEGNANTENAAWKESSFYKSFGVEEEKRTKGLAGVEVRKALFYGACVIDAFAYLHNRRIAYRDLKPENILLNEKGYCIVVDFGFAKIVLDKTYTMCGTPEYLAPEVIVNKGHNHAADYWSFACLLYELIVGQTPFFQAGLDQMSLLKKIVKAEYVFPDEVAKLNPDSGNGIDKALCHWKDLISSLLKPKSVERIGNLRNGIEDILDHDWFAKINFNEFRNQSTPAPWVPAIVDPLDTSHFGNNFSRQEKPERFRHKLSAKDQAVFKNF